MEGLMVSKLGADLVTNNQLIESTLQRIFLETKKYLKEHTSKKSRIANFLCKLFFMLLGYALLVLSVITIVYSKNVGYLIALCIITIIFTILAFNVFNIAEKEFAQYKNALTNVVKLNEIPENVFKAIYIYKQKKIKDYLVSLSKLFIIPALSAIIIGFIKDEKQQNISNLINSLLQSESAITLFIATICVLVIIATIYFALTTLLSVFYLSLSSHYKLVQSIISSCIIDEFISSPQNQQPNNTTSSST